MHPSRDNLIFQNWRGPTPHHHHHHYSSNKHTMNSGVVPVSYTHSDPKGGKEKRKRGGSISFSLKMVTAYLRPSHVRFSDSDSVFPSRRTLNNFEQGLTLSEGGAGNSYNNNHHHPLLSLSAEPKSRLKSKEVHVGAKLWTCGKQKKRRGRYIIIIIIIAIPGFLSPIYTHHIHKTKVLPFLHHKRKKKEGCYYCGTFLLPSGLAMEHAARSDGPGGGEMTPPAPALLLLRQISSSSSSILEIKIKTKIILWFRISSFYFFNSRTCQHENSAKKCN